MSTPFYHRKLLSLLRRQDAILDEWYSVWSNRLSRLVMKYRQFNSSDVWQGNKELEAQFDILLAQMEQSYLTEILIPVSGNAADLANEGVNAMALDYLSKFKQAEAKNMRNELLLRGEAAINGFKTARANGMDLSGRVWSMANANKEMIGYAMYDGILNGKSASEVATKIKKYLKEPDKLFRRVRDENGVLRLSTTAKRYKPGAGVYRSSYKNALRLARNEINIAYRQMEYNRHQDMDFVIGKRINLSPSHPRYDICDELQGIYPKEFRFVGWHPNCLCYVTTELMDQSQFIQYMKTGKKPNDYVTNIPKRAQEYLGTNIDKLNSYKSKPYWLVDNFVDGSAQLKPTATSVSGDFFTPEVNHNGYRDEDIVSVYRAGGLVSQNKSRFDSTQGQLSSHIGYDKLPTLLGTEQFEAFARREGIVRIYRGISGSDVLGQRAVSDFKTGAMFHGKGVYGNGSYFTTDAATADHYGKHRINALLDPSKMKVIDLEDLWAEVKAALKDFNANGDQWIKAVVEERGLDFANPSHGAAIDEIRNDIMALFRDEGTYATWKGYDAISVDRRSDEKYFVVLNRSKLIVEK